MSQLIVVKGLTHRATDLYCTPPDIFSAMTTFEKEDLKEIRSDMLVTCGSKDSFNKLIRAYMDNWTRCKVRQSTAMTGSSTRHAPAALHTARAISVHGCHQVDNGRSPESIPESLHARSLGHSKHTDTQRWRAGTHSPMRALHTLTHTPGRARKHTHAHTLQAQIDNLTFAALYGSIGRVREFLDSGADIEQLSDVSG